MDKRIHGLKIFHINNKNEICIIGDNGARIYDENLKRIFIFKDMSHPYSCCSNKSGELIYFITGNQYIYIIETKGYNVIERRKVKPLYDNKHLGENEFSLSDFILSHDENFLIIKAQLLGTKVVMVHSIIENETKVVFDLSSQEDFYDTMKVGYERGNSCFLGGRREISFTKSWRDIPEVYIAKKLIVQHPTPVFELYTKCVIRKHLGSSLGVEYITDDYEFILFSGTSHPYVYSRSLNKIVKIKTKSFGFKIIQLTCKYYPEEKMLIIQTGIVDNRVFVVRVRESDFEVAEFIGFSNAAKIKNQMLLLSQYSSKSMVLELGEISYDTKFKEYDCVLHYDYLLSFDES